MFKYINAAPMLNAYPDSLGGTLNDIVKLLQKPELKGAFGSFYILPSIFNSDLDRGFSVKDYGLNEALAAKADLDALQALNIDLKLDFILNHASVLSKQFQDILKNGEASLYKDFFINWNRFWEGCGELTEEGYIQPKPELIKDMFFRKPGLPLLMVVFPDGSRVPYWNTFYQEVRFENGSYSYLGQMDLNIKSPLVWDFYEETIKTLSSYGASIVRLDAFAYAPKEPGKKNFLNEPETWELLGKIRAIADKYKLSLLPEIHASYEEKTYEKIANQGYMTYDFFLPGLIIDALERKTGFVLSAWARELKDKGIKTVNMLGCHDGIPLLDLKGLLSEEQIQSLIDTIVSRGGYVKDLHGQKNVYYQVNATYFSALGEDERKLLLSRAIQLFMPGKPQIWYLDLFAGKNDYEAVAKAGAGGHKEINRTNLSLEQAEAGLKKSIVIDQLKLLSFRNSFPAFGFDSAFETDASNDGKLSFLWKNNGYKAELKADLNDCSFMIIGTDPDGSEVFNFIQE